ncbi:unnamed protein product [Aphanomyces euteiches]
MSTTFKRRNFSDEEDLLLLRQVAVEMPFFAPRGCIMEKWTSLAKTLASLEEFRRPNFDAILASNRFHFLLESHRKYNKHSERASGVSEEVSEKLDLLDDLLAAFDDAKEEEALRNDWRMKSTEHDESLGNIVREEALKSMGKHKCEGDDEASSKQGGGKVVKMMSMMHEQVQSELEFQKERFMLDLEDRRKDREVLIEQLRQQQDMMSKLFDALLNK